MSTKTFSNFFVNTFLFSIVLLCLVGISSTDAEAFTFGSITINKVMCANEASIDNNNNCTTKLNNQQGKVFNFSVVKTNTTNPTTSQLSVTIGTDSQGSVSKGGIEFGTYKVCELTPTGFNAIPRPVSGNNGTTGGAQTSSGDCITVDVKVNGNSQLRFFNVPTPTVTSTTGNPSCATLNADNMNYPGITQNYELKLNFTPPSGNSGPYQYKNNTNPSTQLVGNLDLANSVSLQNVRSTNNQDLSIFNFASTKTIIAVIVKASTGSNIYYYSPGTMSGTNLMTPAGKNINHISFCYAANGPSPGTTAATATVSGRVKDINGKVASRVSVTITNVATGEVFGDRTDLFGRYSFTDLPTGQDYLLRVFSGRRVFKENERFINLLEDLTDVDFSTNSGGR